MTTYFSFFSCDGTSRFACSAGTANSNTGSTDASACVACTGNDYSTSTASTTCQVRNPTTGIYNFSKSLNKSLFHWFESIFEFRLCTAIRMIWKQVIGDILVWFSFIYSYPVDLIKPVAAQTTMSAISVSVTTHVKPFHKFQSILVCWVAF